MTTAIVKVPLGGRSYEIHIGSGITGQIDSLAAACLREKHVVLITDDVVGEHYLKPVTREILKVANKLDAITVNAGEASKCIAVCDDLWQQMVQLGVDRKSVVVALGGGVVGDLAGFVAAGYARGIPFVQIPTSLLAQVDSSVGGKTGVNLPQAKNMVGAFWQPETVLIDVDVLQTLDDRNFRAGMAEVIKYGLIMDAALFEKLESSAEALLNRDKELLIEVIRHCCQCKADVVEEDETETSGRRAILNYGHTVGHAIEAVCGYGEYLHGEAIAIGMVAEADLARQLGMIDMNVVQRHCEIFAAYGLPTKAPAGLENELVDAMFRDKKVTQGTLNFVLPNDIGDVVLVEAPSRTSIQDCLKRNSAPKKDHAQPRSF